MGLINLPSMDDILSAKDPKQQMEMLINTVGLLMKSLSEINGYMNSKNVLEVGGWKVDQTALQSNDGDVGMSTEDTGGDDVRFWAGGDKDTAPFQVRNSGKASLTGATIQSASGYPKIIMDPSGNLFGAYSDSDTVIKIVPFFTNSKPAIHFQDGATSLGVITAPDDFEITAENGLNLLSGTGPIYLSTSSIYGIKFDSWSELKNALTGRSLQQDLNAKATAGISTSSVGSHNHGIPDGTVLLTDSGTVTWNASGAHSHTQN